MWLIPFMLSFFFFLKWRVFPQPLHPNTAVFHFELIAVVQAVALVEQLGAVHVDIETDSQMLMLALLNRREADYSPQGATLDDLTF